MEKTLSNIVEVKSRGAEVLALTVRGNQKILSAADDLLFIPDVEPLFSAVVEIVPLQLLAYYTARETAATSTSRKTWQNRSRSNEAICV
jgi:glucosamine--fructose-6-phosphate aminotransferase (isomerizing)